MRRKAFSSVFLLSLLVQHAIAQTNIFAYEPDVTQDRIGSSNTFCDLNGDGEIDLVSGGRNVIVTMLGSNVASSSSPWTASTFASLSGSNFFSNLICLDVNEDGYADIVAGLAFSGLD